MKQEGGEKKKRMNETKKLVSTVCVLNCRDREEPFEIGARRVPGERIAAGLRRRRGHSHNPQIVNVRCSLNHLIHRAQSCCRWCCSAARGQPVPFSRKVSNLRNRRRARRRGPRRRRPSAQRQDAVAAAGDAAGD